MGNDSHWSKDGHLYRYQAMKTFATNRRNKNMLLFVTKYCGKSYWTVIAINVKLLF